MYQCCHHWHIEQANGRESRAECQLCHKTAQFSNFIETPSFTKFAVKPDINEDLALDFLLSQELGRDN